ncbi:hypothetical protein TNCV_4411851 [Trichonephila clavipes]|nr:hypothetical protein TNCV_4411851 [Trichonephila clavipes]
MEIVIPLVLPSMGMMKRLSPVLLSPPVPKSESSHKSGTPWGVLPPLFPFYQPYERTSGLTAIYSTFMPQRHCIFMNIHVFSGIRTQAHYGTAVSVANTIPDGRHSCP